MGEDRAWPGEPAGWYGQGQLGHGFLFQGLHQDAFDPAHVDEVHVQGPAAGGVQTLRRVALSHADELVALSDLGPWQWTVEQPEEQEQRRPGGSPVPADRPAQGGAGFLGGKVRSMTPAQRRELTDRQHRHLSIVRQCQLMGVSGSVCL